MGQVFRSDATSDFPRLSSRHLFSACKYYHKEADENVIKDTNSDLDKRAVVLVS